MSRLLPPVTGQYSGTGSALTVSCGFAPSFLRIINLTDGTTVAEYNAAMAAGTCLKITGAGPANVASNGITPLSRGFQVGTDGSINTSGKTYLYVAM